MPSNVLRPNYSISTCLVFQGYEIIKRNDNTAYANNIYIRVVSQGFQVSVVLNTTCINSTSSKRANLNDIDKLNIEHRTLNKCGGVGGVGCVCGCCCWVFIGVWEVVYTYLHNQVVQSALILLLPI